MSLKSATAEFVAGVYYASFSKIDSVGTTISAVVSGGGWGSDSVSSDATTISTIASQVYTAAEAVATTVQPVGMALSVMFFMVALVEFSVQDRMTMESFIKFFAKLAASLYAIYYSSTIASYCISFGDALSTMMVNALSLEASSSLPSQSDIATDFENVMDGGGQWIILLLGGMVMGIPIYLVSVALIGVAYVITFTRILELAVRICFLPIAMGLLSDDGWRGAGGRYIRKFLAICSQGAVLCLIASMTEYTVGAAETAFISNFAAGSLDSSSAFSVLESYGSVLVVMIGVCIACISLMFKSIGIVNDAFGG